MNPRLLFHLQENRSFRRAQTLLLLAGVATLVVALLNPPVRAQIANTDVIHACVQIATGITRIVTADVGCRENESRVNWNIQGPAELQGPPGEGGIKVLDANDNVLGTLVGLSQATRVPNGVVIFKDGYFTDVHFSGKFPVGRQCGGPAPPVRATSISAMGPRLPGS